MVKRKSPRNWGKLYVSILVNIALVLALATLALSQSLPANQPISVIFEPRPEDAAQDPHDFPEISGGGLAGMPSCQISSSDDKAVLTALIPKKVMPVTLSERPTLLFYIPPFTGGNMVAEFLLQDENEDEVYSETFALNRQAGIISFALPSNAPSLKVGKTYQWGFSMVCDSSGDLALLGSVRGRLQRIEISPTLAKGQELATPLQRAAFYAKHGIWVEALINLAEARRSQPNDSKLAEEWRELLKSVNLEILADKPLLEGK